MNVAMADDSPEDLEIMRAALQEYAAANHMEIVFQPFHSGEELLADYHPFLYSVIFLDIFMDGMTGIETAERIREADEETLLVFLTENNDQQADAIHWHVYDYILKTDGQEAIWKVMDRILHTRTQMEKERLTFSVNRKNIALPYAEIVSLRTERNYLVIQDKKGTEYRTRMTFSSAQEQLRDSRFLEILRGVIVNLDYVSAFSEMFCLLKGGSRLPVNIKNQKKLVRIWQNYLFAQTRNESGS